MCKILYEVFLFIAVVVTIIKGHPAKDELMFNKGDDTAVVESTVREARAAAVPELIEDLLEPGVKEAFLHTYGDDEKHDGDVHGYHKKSQDKGNDGYQHFDSYHKKDGDKYGYESHSEYGKDNKAKTTNKNKSGKYSLDHNDGDSAETKNSYKLTGNENNDGHKNGVQSIESYDDDGDFGFYADSGSENYFEDDDDAGDDKESGSYEVYEGYEDGDEDSGEKETYTEAEDDDDGESYEYYDY